MDAVQLPLSVGQISLEPGLSLLQRRNALLALEKGLVSGRNVGLGSFQLRYHAVQVALNLGQLRIFGRDVVFQPRNTLICCGKVAFQRPHPALLSLKLRLEVVCTGLLGLKLRLRVRQLPSKQLLLPLKAQKVTLNPSQLDCLRVKLCGLRRQRLLGLIQARL